jgi:hypothetical protein
MSHKNQCQHLVFFDTNQYVDNVVLPVFKAARDVEVLEKILVPIDNTPLESDALLPGLLELLQVHVMASDDLMGKRPGQLPTIPTDQIDLGKHVLSVRPCFQFYFIALMNARTRVAINGGPWYVMQAYQKNNREWVQFHRVFRSV